MQIPVFSPPLVPDSDEAREWAREELSRSVYSTRQSLWEWLWEQLTALLEKITSLGSGFGAAFVPLVILGIIVAVVILALTFSGPIRRRRAAVEASGGMWQGDDERSAAELRAAAHGAATAGDFSLAVIEQFRATVRALEERSLLETTQGMTASEVATAIGAIFPSHHHALRSAATTFNDALYGAHRAGPADFTALVELERHLDGAQPQREMLGQV